MYRIRKLFHPEIYQGKHKESNYFEGWYFKFIDSSLQYALAVIPGISKDKANRDSHAFIQVLINNNLVEYFRFEPDDFWFNDKKFEIRIADNYFSRDNIRLNLKGVRLQLKGTLYFTNIIMLPKTLMMPGIMGPYSYLTCMECYHGIINIHHDIRGSLYLCRDKIDFNKGYGYIEKDWGKSFPKAWVWFQSNHFGEDDATIMFSIAEIPLFGRTFPGFISFLRLGEKLYVFATYSGASIRRLQYVDKGIRILLKDRKYRLQITVYHSEGGVLKAPVNGRMEREIIESINAKVKVILTDKKGNLIYQGKGTNTGLEIIGKRLYIE